MRKAICCIFNIAAHYREAIYKRIDVMFNPDFYIGDADWISIKTMCYEELSGFRKKLEHKKICGKFYWQRGELSLSLENYDKYLITGTPYCLSTWLLLIILKLRGKETYAWTHGFYGKENSFVRLIKFVYFSLFTKILLYGNYAKRLMIQNGFSKDKLIVIYNSLDYDRQLSVRIKLKITDIYKKHFCNDYPVIVYVGRIQKIKRLDLLLYAVALLENRIDLNLVFVGKQVDDIDLWKIVEQKSLSKKVWFYGECFDENALGELFYNATVCVSPGNIGLTALHSLMYGTPVLTHDDFCEQMPEFEVVKEGITGECFRRGDIDCMANSIEKWILLSNSERDVFRQNCYSVIDGFYNPDYQMEQLELLFN